MMTDRFSLRRLAMVAGYYKRPVARQLMIYGAVVAVMAAFSAVFAEYYEVLYVLYGMCCGLMIFLGPVGFAHDGTTVVDTLLPCRAGEKFTLMLVHSLIVVPVVIDIVWFGVWLVASLFTETPPLGQLMFGPYVSMVDIDWKLKTAMILQSQLSLPMATVFYIVVVSRSHTFLKSLLGVAAAMMAVMVGSFIMGIIAALTDLDAVAMMHNGGDDVIAPPQFVYTIVYTVIGVTLIYFITMMILSYRKIAHRQI